MGRGDRKHRRELSKASLSASLVFLILLSTGLIIDVVSAQAPTRLTIQPSPSSIPGDQNTVVTVSGRLTRADTGVGVANREVHLSWDRYSPGQFVAIFTGRTGSDGWYQVPVLFDFAGTLSATRASYTIGASFSGDSQYLPTYATATLRVAIGSEIVAFSYGHYYVKVPRELRDRAMQWVKDVNDHTYPVMVQVLGFQPSIDFYIVEFAQLQTAGGYYDGVKTVDGHTGGHIVLHFDTLKTLRPFPDDLAYGLTYETIHGFLEPLKHSPYTRERTVLDWDESFDIIFEAEVLARLELWTYVNELYRVFYPMKEFRYFAVLWDIRKDLGWSPFQKLFVMIAQQGHLPVNDDTLCYYLSVAANSDVSPYFKKHGLQTSGPVTSIVTATSSVATTYATSYSTASITQTSMQETKPASSLTRSLSIPTEITDSTATVHRTTQPPPVGYDMFLGLALVGVAMVLAVSLLMLKKVCLPFASSPSQSLITAKAPRHLSLAKN